MKDLYSIFLKRWNVKCRNYLGIQNGNISENLGLGNLRSQYAKGDLIFGGDVPVEIKKFFSKKDFSDDWGEYFKLEYSFLRKKSFYVALSKYKSEVGIQLKVGSHDLSRTHLDDVIDLNGVIIPSLKIIDPFKVNLNGAIILDLELQNLEGLLSLEGAIIGNLRVPFTAKVGDFPKISVDDLLHIYNYSGLATLRMLFQDFIGNHENPNQ